MPYYVKKSKRDKLPPKVRKRMYHKDATLAQINQRNKVIQFANAYRGQPSALLLTKLVTEGYHPSEKRIYTSGGVGSWCWLPKFGIFRIQVRASHISTKGAYMPYALCVEV